MALAIATSMAHEGETHAGDPEPSSTPPARGLQAESMGRQDYDVLLQLPEHARPRESCIARIYLSDRTNAPIAGASITLEISGPSSRATATATTTGVAGIYTAELPPLQTGTYRLTATVTADRTSVLALSSLTVPEIPTTDLEPHEPSSLPRALGGGVVASAVAIGIGAWARRAGWRGSALERTP